MATATDPKKTTALAPVEQRAEPLNALAQRARDAVVATAKGEIAKAFTLALAVKDLRAAIVPLVAEIRPLIGTALGFLTDRDKSDKGAYSDAVVTDCLVEATCRGLRWTGNELNIIGGRCYTTKAGYRRLVAELPGLSDLDMCPAVPRLAEGGAVVKYRATWRLDGKVMVIDRDIPVRLNAGMGADAALGKAERKMYAAIHARVTGSVQSMTDAETQEEIEEPKAKPPAKAPVQLAEGEIDQETGEVGKSLEEPQKPADPAPAAKCGKQLAEEIAQLAVEVAGGWHELGAYPEYGVLPSRPADLTAAEALELRAKLRKEVEAGAAT